MTPFLLLLVACVALEYLIVAALAIKRRAPTGAIIVVALFVVEAMALRLPSINVGVNVGVQDAVFIPIAIAAFLRSIGPGALRWPRVLPWILFLLFATSLLRGVHKFGLTASGNESRGDFYFLATVCLFSTFSYTPTVLSNLVRIWMKSSLVLLLLAVFRWILTLTGLGISSQWHETAGPNLRVLTAAQAMFLAMGLFLSLQLNLLGHGTQWQRRLAYLLAPAIVMLQHRTVWIVSIVALLWVFASHGRLRSRIAERMIFIALAGSSLILILFGTQVNDVVTWLRSSATNTGTFEWRLEGWRALVAGTRGVGPIDRLFGEPFGSGYLRYIHGYPVDVSPHNYYIQIYLRLGFVGLSILLAMYLVTWTLLRRVELSTIDVGYPDYRFWRLVLLSHLVYFITYSPSYEQGILVGTALSLASVTRADQVIVRRDQREQRWRSSALQFS